MQPYIFRQLLADNPWLEDPGAFAQWTARRLPEPCLVRNLDTTDWLFAAE